TKTGTKTGEDENRDIQGYWRRNRSPSSSSEEARLGGRPGGRSEDSKPSAAAVRSTHAAEPNGVPRSTLRRKAASSASLFGSCTSSSQAACRGTGPGSSQGSSGGRSHSGRLDQPQSSARATRPARSAFRSA